ncbi:MAG TPA: esterase-like activity of phytase family protein [Mycobacteriales bacterium]|nr:esterase-like activity of phytase family protein [Mycobacteriales bacterium]
MTGKRTRLGALTGAVLAATLLATAGPAAAAPPAPGSATLIGRAVLPAATFAGGPVSGQYIGAGPIAGQPVPFAHQPVQGFSGLLPVRGTRGDYWALMDNGYGAEENSADSLLRIYRIRPDLTGPKTNGVKVVDHIDLADPDHRVSWTIVNFFTRQRLLTGADFDPESLQQAPDGSFWIGDEFGPFILHFSRSGRLLEAPIADPGLRSPQSPDLEEAQSLRVMDALRQHAQQFGGATPIVSPDFNLLVDNNPATAIASRANPPAGSGVPAASSEILNVATLHTAGFKVVPYTADTAEAIDALLKLGVDGIISDNSDLLHQRLAAFDANGDGVPGDYLLPDGRVDRTRFDAEGHRGSRGLRPENTLPAFEAGLDNLMNTMETDTGITRDGVPVISHDPFLDPAKCRNADGSALPGQILIRDLTARQIQRNFVCDLTLPAFPRQSDDVALSPVAAAYAATHHLDPYTKPRLQDLFDFAAFYARWFSTGPGRHDAGAAAKAANARTVHFNVETKVNPVPALASRTVSAEAFERIDDGLIARNHLQSRVTLQSFDWRTLLLAQQNHPDIATVALWGDSPIFADPTITGSGDGGNLQPVGGNTPWLGGLIWPWRQTLQTLPARVQASGGFEGMAMSPDGRTLYPALEKPLVNPATTTALIAQFDIRSRSYTGTTWAYSYAPGGISIPDLQLYAPGRGVAIERDNSTGTLTGLKEVFAVTLPAGGGTVTKTPVADLLHIADPAGIARRDRFAQPGDLIGDPGQFAMPFVTIEAVVVQDRRTLVIVNDNNYPFSVGRHIGTGRTDDNDVVALRLGQSLPS